MSKKPQSFYQEIGKKGGIATSEKYGAKHFADAGAKGAASVAELYGREHFVKAGKAGAAARAAKKEANIV